MSDGSSIQWCDATWQPIVGCRRVSAGCDNCYAIGTVNRFRKRDGLTKLRPKNASRPGLDWSGKVLLQPERLADPLRWKKPRRVFVCSQADLFHDAVPFEYIAAVFGVMAACPQHTFLVLTKLLQRAREFFSWVSSKATAKREAACTDISWPRIVCAVLCAKQTGHSHPVVSGDGGMLQWPLPNVHLGASVEDQATADERIPVLLELPAALHWVSAEPLLGPVSLWRAMQRSRSIRWVVIGGESGPRARPFRIEWARSIVAQCRDAGTLAFVKQLGSQPEALDFPGGYLPLQLADYSGGDMAEWPADLRVREVPT